MILQHHIYYIDLSASIIAISEGKIKGCGILTSMVPLYVPSYLLSLFYLRLILKKVEYRKRVESMKNRRADTGVSEVIGVVLLLVMAIALFSTIYLFVMDEALDVSEKASPSATVLGTIGGSDIILEHRGGDALSLDTKIMITISGVTYNMTIGDLLDNESKGDGKWNIGERLSYAPSLDITGRQVRILVIDEESGSVIMQGILQEGDASVDPFVVTRYATNVLSYSAKLWMEYDFKT